MEFEAISRIGGASLPTVLPGAHGSLAEPSVAATPLDEAREVEQETIEQRASNGDLKALEKLTAEVQQMIPISSQQLLPPGPARATVHEPGKGTIVDLYD